MKRPRAFGPSFDRSVATEHPLHKRGRRGNPRLPRDSALVLGAQNRIAVYPPEAPPATVPQPPSPSPPLWACPHRRPIPQRSHPDRIRHPGNPRCTTPALPAPRHHRGHRGPAGAPWSAPWSRPPCIVRLLEEDHACQPWYPNHLHQHKAAAGKVSPACRCTFRLVRYPIRVIPPAGGGRRSGHRPDRVPVPGSPEPCGPGRRPGPASRPINADGADHRDPHSRRGPPRPALIDDQPGLPLPSDGHSGSLTRIQLKRQGPHHTLDGRRDHRRPVGERCRPRAERLPERVRCPRRRPAGGRPRSTTGR